MSADLLRQAAALMRERATKAMASLSDNVPEWHSVRALMGEGKTEGDAEHIASWRPAVALAVAKAMDDVAHAWEIADEADDGWVYDADDNHYRFEETVDGGWLAVARAYLGSNS
jgi:hypothetical protein